MFLLYNLVLHGAILPINFAIIFKELSLEKWGLIHANTSSDSKHAKQNLSLGYSDASKGLHKLFWFLNPFTWVDLFWTFWFGWDLKDIYEENPYDEEHYWGNH